MKKFNYYLNREIRIGKQTKMLILFAIICYCVFLVVDLFYVLPASAKSQLIYPDISQKLFLATNNQREKKLRWNECLAQKALERAREMYQNNYFSHQNPKSKKYPAWDMIGKCYYFVAAGENLTKDFTSAETAQNTLMHSPTHRANILNPNFLEAGFACFKNVCVEFFATNLDEI